MVIPITNRILRALRCSISRALFLRRRSLSFRVPNHEYLSQTELRHDQYRSSLFKCLSENRLTDARQLLNEMSQRVGSSRVAVHCSSFLSDLSRSGRVSDAQRLFDLSPEKNIFINNAMLSVLVSSGDLSAAKSFFESMTTKNVVSWTLLLSVLMGSGRISDALEVFKAIPSKNLVTWNSLLCGLTRNKDLKSARLIFDRMPVRNVISWNAMISGYIESSMIAEARALFDAAAVEEHRNVVTWTTMVSGYCRAGDVAEAYSLFRVMPERNVVSWTAMIGGFSRNGFFKEAILVFLQWKKRAPNEETLAALAYACAGFGAPELGKQIHAQAIANGFDMEARKGKLGVALIRMYSVFRYFNYAHSVFASAPESFNKRIAAT